MMSAGRYRWLLIAVVLLLVFGAAAALTLHFLPRPWRRGDYLVAGSVATLVTLLVLFIFLAVAGLLSGRVSLGRRRPR
jgi:heme/copper-type cytochrome/quinol oxidase subunit 2